MTNQVTEFVEEVVSILRREVNRPFQFDVRVAVVFVEMNADVVNLLSSVHSACGMNGSSVTHSTPRQRQQNAPETADRATSEAFLDLKKRGERLSVARRWLQGRDDPRRTRKWGR